MIGADIKLPAPFDTWKLDAHIERGRRKICLDSPEPGSIYRNPYERAHLFVAEEAPWSGECRWVWSERITSKESYVRHPFTDKAREAMRAAILPPLHRYGFDRLWNELWSPYHESFDREIAVAKASVKWWEDRADLTNMHAAGLAEFKPVEHDWTRHPKQVRTLGAHNGRDWDWAHVTAEVWVAGQHAGWLTDGGRLIPFDTEIEHADRVRP